MDWLGDLAALVPAIIAVAVVIALALVLLVVIVLALTRQELEADWSAKKLKVRPRGAGGGAPDGLELGKFREALWVYGEIAPALVGVIEAGTPLDANIRAKEWFNKFSAQLSHALGMGDDERYRVTVWTVDAKNPATLRALGSHLTSRTTLPVAESVAGHVFTTGRPYYVRDCADDPIYRPLGNREKAYKSVYSEPLGPEGRRWGALTVDATEVDGIDECDQQIIQSLAGLAAAAEATWRNERREQTERSER